MSVVIHGAQVCRHGRVLSYDLTSEASDDLPEAEGCNQCTDEQIAFDSRYLTAEQLEDVTS